MRRRDFIAALVGTAAMSSAARAQQSLPIIGFLSSRSPTESTHLIAAFKAGLGEMGFAEGKNALIAFRWADGSYRRLPGLAAELVSLGAAVIITAGGAPSTLAAKAATPTIPIVFTSITDPVRAGVVTSLSRPEANVTGLASFGMAVGSKRLGLLRELVPSTYNLAMLVNPNYPRAEADKREVEIAARGFGLEFHVVSAATERELNMAFETIGALKVGALIVGADPYFESQRHRIVELSARYAIPASYAWRDYVEIGGLMSYGNNIADNYKEAGIYAGRILRGEKPGNLPVKQPTKFELVVNLKTAKTLGLVVPNSMQLLADEMIE